LKMNATAVKGRPILFSGPMVRAILEGRKTQTRRIVKLDAELKARGCTSLKGSWRDPGLGAGAYLKVPGPHETAHRLYCPHGYRGDQLWVKETWTAENVVNRQILVVYRASCFRDEFDLINGDGSVDRATVKRWKPSIFMPREWSRIILEITNVRVERLKEITTSDAVAEGVGQKEYAARHNASEGPALKRLCALAQHYGQPIAAYADLWNSLNAERGFGWEKNPWVWVIEFKRIRREDLR